MSKTGRLYRLEKNWLGKWILRRLKGPCASFQETTQGYPGQLFLGADFVSEEQGWSIVWERHEEIGYSSLWGVFVLKDRQVPTLRDIENAERERHRKEDEEREKEEKIPLVDPETLLQRLWAICSRSEVVLHVYPDLLEIVDSKEGSTVSNIVYWLSFALGVYDVYSYQRPDREVRAICSLNEEDIPRFIRALVVNEADAQKIIDAFEPHRLLIVQHNKEVKVSDPE